jgi:hypothetical protein
MRAKFDTGQWRPLVLVKLTMGVRSQHVWMLVDSGADRTTIDPDLATAMTGMAFDDFDPGPPILGAGKDPSSGGEPSREAEATIEYLGRQVATRLWITPTPYPVLGRNDFMKQFQCSFYWDRNPPEFTVVPIPVPRAPKPPNPTIRPNPKRRRK